jgi:RNA polymerase sigma-70 factor (ECF subfamily)
VNRNPEYLHQELLIIRFRKGDTSVFEEIITYWEPQLLYYIRRLVISEEDAWDVLQEVWYKVLRQLQWLKDEKAFPKWLYAIARSTALDLLRRRRKLEPFDTEENPSVPESIYEPELSILDALALHQALERLSLPHREVVTLHFLEDFSIAEIAEIVNTTPGTVKSRLFYAKRELRIMLLSSRDAQRSVNHA